VNGSTEIIGNDGFNDGRAKPNAVISLITSFVSTAETAIASAGRSIRLGERSPFSINNTEE
jgi:hypothetical protein